MFKFSVGLVLSIVILFAVEVEASDRFKEGVHYTHFPKATPTATPQLTEYFSVFCPACYNVEVNRNIIEQYIPKHITRDKVHVTFVNGTNRDGFQAIAQATALSHLYRDQLGNDLMWRIFGEIHEHRQRPQAHDIRRIVSQFNTTNHNYSELMDSFRVKALANQMSEKQREAQRLRMVTGVPTFIVNGQYRLNLQHLSQDNWAKELGDLIDYLSQKNAAADQ